MTLPTNYYEPHRGFRVWSRTEILTEHGTGKWVPNPGDLVFDPTQGFFIVVDVDPFTHYSQLKPWSPPAPVVEEGDQDELVAFTSGFGGESFRMYVDTSVTPHTLSPDDRINFYRSSVDHYKVFLGTDINPDLGRVISIMFDPSGNFLGTAIPVESRPATVTRNGVEFSTTVKVPMVGYTSEKLEDGETVTLVAYSADGGVQKTATLIVKNTAVLRRADTSRKYIKNITLDTPFLSSADPQVVEFPINVAVEALPMTAVVHYSDGSKHRMAVDGGKFSLYGLRDYIATVVGQEFPMVLTYQLSEDEVSYNLEPTANRRLTVEYRAKTAPVDGAYEVKLYVFPVWASPELGYRLEYWLYNLDRQDFYNVTPYIEMGVNSQPFRPTDYGVLQTLTVALDLNKVDGRFAPYRHVQTFQVALMSRGDSPQPNWVVHFRPDQEEGYGRDLLADLEYVNTNYWRLRLGNGFPSKELWLENLYGKIEPLFHEEKEVEAPTPTHFRVVFLHNQYEFSVEQWDDALVVNNDLRNGEALYIQWIRRTATTDLQLGISALPVKQREMT